MTGGWDERGIAAGGTPRNAWKVSERSGRHWADNPAHHNTTPSPTALISALLSLRLLSLKPIRRARCLLTFTCHVLPKKTPLNEPVVGLMMDNDRVIACQDP